MKQPCLGLVETVRQRVRSATPSWLYQRAALLYGSGVAAMRLGPRDYAALLRARHADRNRPPVELRAPGLAHPLLVRPGTTDATVFEGNLLREDYGGYRLESPVSFIVDAGANAGYASAYLLSRYPEARLVAVEPDAANLELAAHNLRPYGGRVELVRAGLWPTCAKLRVRDCERADGIRVEAVRDGEPHDCQGLDPLSLLRAAGEERISLFKCDIEGAEERLFAESADAWLERTDSIFIEIHSPAARAAVCGAVGRHPFEHLRHRGLDVFVRRRTS